MHSGFAFFFFPYTWTVKLHDFTVYETKNTVYALFTYCLCTVYVLFTGSTILFTHLKIILLQYFQFLIFNFTNNNFNPNRFIILLIKIFQFQKNLKQSLKVKLQWSSKKKSKTTMHTIIILFIFKKKFWIRNKAI